MKRLPSLDGLRGIAAVAVMEFHFAVFFLPQAGLLKIIPYLGRAYLSVDLFYLISGFVMAHVYWTSAGVELAGALAEVCDSAVRSALSPVCCHDIGHSHRCPPLSTTHPIGIILRSFTSATAIPTATMGFRSELELSLLVD